MAPPSLADRLLDAQVDWIVAELTGPDLPALLERDVDDLLAVAGRLPLEQVVDRDEIRRIVHRSLEAVPASTVVSTMVQASADILHDGPATGVAPAEVLDRAQVEALVDATLRFRPLVGAALDGVADSPRMGALASGFVTRIVVEVLEANRTMTQRIPGVGSLVSFGTNAATKVAGAAGDQLQGLLGATAGKGAAFAVRRLNAAVMDTLEDPSLREALLEVWDARADQPLDARGRAGAGAEWAGNDRAGITVEDARALAAALQDAAIAAAPSEPVLALVDAHVDALFDVYGEHPVAVLLEELEITRDDLVADACALVPPVLAAAAADGWLADAVRTRLAPFFASAEVAALLDGAGAP